MQKEKEFDTALSISCKSSSTLDYYCEKGPYLLKKEVTPVVLEPKSLVQNGFSSKTLIITQLGQQP